MKLIYSILIIFVSLLLPLKLFVRGFKESDYRKNILERYGFVKNAESKRIWVHCISVGESIAAKQLCLNLLEKHDLIITCTTASGRKQLNEMYKDQIQSNRVLISYIPVDLKIVVTRVIKIWNPSQIIFIETDIWPNICKTAKKQNIPIKLMNARLSVNSFQGYKKLGRFISDTINCFDSVGAQFDLDAEHFIKLGLEKSKVVVTGSIKADITFKPNPKITKMITDKDRFVWIAASTHAPEEELLVQIHKNILKKYPSALLILAPRHPNRFKEVQLILDNCDLDYSMKTNAEFVSNETKVFLLDAIGELMDWMNQSQIVFMGKSLGANGGHNPLEPAYLAKAIISGRQVQNFENVYQSLVNNDAAILVNNIDELSEVLFRLIENRKQIEELGQNARNTLDGFSGALNKTMSLIEK